MKAELFRILYCSRNMMDSRTCDADLAQILADARRNNSRSGVTGALLYNSGIFAQTLEGSFDAVQGIFERIQIDHRHTDVVILEARSVSERIFGGWSMAFAEPSDPIGTNAVLSKALLDKDGDGHAVLGLLDQVVNREVCRLPVDAYSGS